LVPAAMHHRWYRRTNRILLWLWAVSTSGSEW
jgi:hypothetical protein